LTPARRASHPEAYLVHWRPWAFLLAAAVLALGLVWLCWPFSLDYLRTQNPQRTSMMKFREAQARTRHLPYRLRQAWVPLDRISPRLQKAVIAAEDDTFYEHAGVDFVDLWESVKQDWKQMQYVRGGSSLTQQVAKNLFLSPQKLLVRKLKEFFLAFRLDRTLGKKRVLEIYLNIAEWGPGVFGAEAAARAYFHKSAADLTLDEAVGLAAVLPSPLKHSPLQTGRYVQWRKAWILGRLQRYGGLREAPAPADSGPPDWVESDEADADLALPEARGDSLNAEVLPAWPGEVPAISAANAPPVPAAADTSPDAEASGETRPVTPAPHLQ
jgi:monofunctional biosynthetic peptidoglycan transglycosylase